MTSLKVRSSPRPREQEGAVSIREAVFLSQRTLQREDKDDEEVVSDNTSCDTALLFPKESRDPLFPNLVSSSPRKHFIVMTCKRTIFACRGIFLVCFALFLIFSFVAGNSSSSSEGDGGSGAADDESGSASESVSAQQEEHQLRKEKIVPKRYETISLLLPNSLKNVAGKKNSSQIQVEFNSDCGYTKSSYALIGNSLRRSLEFFGRSVRDLTVLDAALGTKIVAEQMSEAKKRHPKLPNEIRTFIGDLERKAKTLTQQITTNVKLFTDNPKGLKYTLPWIEIEGLWTLPENGTWHPLGELKNYEPIAGQDFEDLWNIVSRGEIIDEKESDACIFQVFHCDTNNITSRCREVFLDVERSMYSLTHQVIYMLLARKNKCYEQPTWRRVPNLRDKGDEFLEELCGRVWQEANSIADAEFPPRFRDLFIEQIGMCSLAGYTEFLNRAWLRRIISWQSISASGCFGEKGRRRVPAYPNVATVLRDYQSQELENMYGYQNYHNYNSQSGSYRPTIYDNGRYRRKRSDVYVADGDNRDKCSVHFTSVGITALSIHLRYMIDACLDAY